MTTTYDVTTNVGKVRLLIGDTDITDAQFTDEEIEVFLDQASDDVNIAAANALEAWAAAEKSTLVSETIGDYSYKRSVSDMLATAKSLREKAANTPYLTWSELDLESIGDPEDD